jgi:outer membrane protein
MKKLLLACLLAFAPFTIASADLKVAVIDLSKAFDSYYKTKDAQAKITDKQQTYTKEIQGYITDYQHMGEEADALNKGANDPTLAQPAREDKAKALVQKKQDLIALGNKIQEMKVERSREIQEEILRRHTEIVDEITKIVTDYAGTQGYDLVLDRSRSNIGISTILYNSNKLIDITSDIVTRLNKTAPAAGTTPETPATPAAPATP